MIGGRQLQDLSLVSENQKSVTLGKTPLGSVSVKKNVGNLTTVTNADVLRLIVGEEPTPYCLLKLSDNNPDIIINPGGGPIELPRVEEISDGETPIPQEDESVSKTKRRGAVDTMGESGTNVDGVTLGVNGPETTVDGVTLDREDEVDESQSQTTVDGVSIEGVDEPETNADGSKTKGEPVAYNLASPNGQPNYNPAAQEQKPSNEYEHSVQGQGSVVSISETKTSNPASSSGASSASNTSSGSSGNDGSSSATGGSRNRKKTHIKRTKKNKTIKKRYIQQGGLKANVLMFNRNGERCVNGNVYTDKQLSKGIYNGQTVSNLEPLTTYSRNTGKPCSGNWTKMFPIEAGTSSPSGDTGSGSSSGITINSKTIEKGINKFTKAMGSADINLSGTTETDGTKRKSGKKGKEKQIKGDEMGSEQFNGDIEEGETNNSFGSESMGYGYGMGMGGMPERNTIHSQSHSADAGKGKTSGKDKSKGKSKSIGKTGQLVAQSQVGTQAGTQAGTQVGTQAGTQAGNQAGRKIKGINLGVKQKVTKMASASSQPISMNMSSQQGSKGAAGNFFSPGDRVETTFKDHRQGAQADKAGATGAQGAPPGAQGTGAKPPAQAGQTGPQGTKPPTPPPPPPPGTKPPPPPPPPGTKPPASEAPPPPGAQGAPPGAQGKEAPASGPSQSDKGPGAQGPGAQGADKGDKGPGAQGADKGDKGPGAQGADKGDKGPGAQGAEKGPGAQGKGTGEKGKGTKKKGGPEGKQGKNKSKKKESKKKSVSKLQKFWKRRKKVR